MVENYPVYVTENINHATFLEEVGWALNWVSHAVYEDFNFTVLPFDFGISYSIYRVFRLEI